MDKIKEKAEAFSLSYAAAMELSLKPSTTRRECAEALCKHYKPGIISFIFGNAVPMTDPLPLIEGYLERLDNSGLGWKVHLEKHEVVPYSAGSAQCWLTWAIEPKDGRPGWNWTNIYGYRLPPGEESGEGYWEYNVSDHENGELLKREPNLFS